MCNFLVFKNNYVIYFYKFNVLRIMQIQFEVKIEIVINARNYTRHFNYLHSCTILDINMKILSK